MNSKVKRVVPFLTGILCLFLTSTTGFAIVFKAMPPSEESSNWWIYDHTGGGGSSHQPSGGGYYNPGPQYRGYAGNTGGKGSSYDDDRLDRSNSLYAHKPISFTPSTSSPELPSLSYYNANSNSVIFWSNEPGQLSIPVNYSSDVVYDEPVKVYVNGQLVYNDVPTLGSDLTLTVTPSTIFSNDQIQWLSDHRIDAMDLSNAMIEDGFSPEGISVAQQLVDSARKGIDPKFLDAFIYGLIHFYWPWEDITQAAVDEIKREVAMFRLEHPELKPDDWYTPYFKVITHHIHNGFDIAGAIPIVGEGFDFVNGVLYTLEGDHFNAALSFGSTIPIAGWATLGAKWGFAALVVRRAGRYDEIPEHLIWKVVTETGEIEFKETKNQLRTLMANMSSGRLNVLDESWEAQRIIDEKFFKHPVIQEAAKAQPMVPGKLPFHPNHPFNGIDIKIVAGATKEHPMYDQQVARALDQIASDINQKVQSHSFRNMNEQYEFARTQVEGLQAKIRLAIEQFMASNPDPSRRFVDLDQVHF